MRQVEEILKKNQLSVTVPRQRILTLFLKTKGALSHSDIETSEAFDRVTVYRTLLSFTEKGIVHTIPTADNSIRYALCSDDCHTGHHHDNHVHFICDECSKTICLPDVTIPKVKLPKGFTPAHSEMVVSGICEECR